MEHQKRKDTRKIKSDNFTGSNKEMLNIAIAPTLFCNLGTPMLFSSTVTFTISRARC